MVPTPGAPLLAPPPGSVVASTGDPGAVQQVAPVGQPQWEDVSRKPLPRPLGGGAGGDPNAEPDPLAQLSVPSLAPPDKDRTPKRKAPPLGRIIGNRDFVIFVDCYNDYARVSPGGIEFRWPAYGASNTDQQIVQYVQQLIQRRQASVRPGEPPYRPLIRFHVAPDGLRTYYRAYPPLEPLKVPMTRENLEE
jgi:hypothetical protein